MWSDTVPDDEKGLKFFRRSAAGTGPPLCPSPELVQASQSGTLPPPLQERVARHVEACAVCQTLAEALDDASVGGPTEDERARILQRVRTGLGRSGRAPVRVQWWQWSAAAAAVALLAIGSAIVWQFRSAPAPVQVARDIHLPAAPSVFTLDKPAIQPSAASDILWRGSATPEAAADLARAVEPYVAGDFAEAARRLRALVSRDPQNAAGHFYLGVSDLFLDRDAEAVKSLEIADQLSKGNLDLEREVVWYLALAYRRTGQIERAGARLAALCRGQGPRAGRACAGLRQLAGPRTVFGTVTGPDGVPLAGVSVGELVVRLGPAFNVAGPSDVSTTTDANGDYKVAGVQTPVVRASKPGYFTAGKVVSRTQDTRVDFVLQLLVYVSLGQVIRGRVEAGDLGCGDPQEVCDQFALAVPARGTLEVSLASSIPSDLDLHVETPAGEAFGPPIGAPYPLRVSVQAEAGATYQIRVVGFADRPRDFELTTRLLR
jgi:hypothetical protein